MKDLNDMSLQDLKELRLLIIHKLSSEKAYMDCQRGYDYFEYCRREESYNKSENHSKLKQIDKKIEEYINFTTK